MRKNFYELLSQREFTIHREYETLWRLFCVEPCYYTYSKSYSLSRWIDIEHFRTLPFRGSFTSLSNMMDELGICAYSTTDIDVLLLFCELIYAVIPWHSTNCTKEILNQVETISHNINYILEQTNHEFREDSEGRNIIVEKNKAATLAAELVDDETVAFELIEYNHFALKGDLAGKRKLLVSIAAYIEPILRDHTLKNHGYPKLESDAGFLFNNFHIRHNNKVGNTAKEYITSISDNELEEWYDKAYEVALSVIIINDYLSINQEISDVKTKYSWGN